MNYRHSYHAGSFADVFKHTVLSLLIQALRGKEKPFCYFDTHAGAGRYDLLAETTQKTGEFELGIGQIWHQVHTPPEILTYLDAVTAINELPLKETFPRFYPGSPRIVRHFLRLQDRMVLTELHPEDAALLKREFRHDPQVAVHQRDGYEALKALLPPKERRGLVLIDPPYEQNNEVDRIIKALRHATQRWETGMYAIWYPLKDKVLAKNLCLGLETHLTSAKNILLAELSIYPNDTSLSLNGSGMIIINPPWQLDIQLKQILPWLWQTLSPQMLGSYRVEWLATNG